MSEADLQIARVCVDSPLTHLDRLFDYLIPDEFADQVTVGCRVNVRFAGRLLDGYVLDLVADSAHGGRLAPLVKVISPEPVLSPAVARLTRAVADRYAGTQSDVLRLAVPPRRVRPEKLEAAEPATASNRPSAQMWARYPRGSSYLDAVSEGRPARAVLTLRPGEDWPTRLAESAATAAAGGRGVLIVLPDVREVERVDAALTALTGVGTHIALTADLKPEERYRRFLAIRRGGVRVVIGTRAAAFAPVADLGLVAIWDDGDDLHAEPRAPYPHAREVLLLRAHLENCAALIAGWSCSTEGALLVESGWAHAITAEREEVRQSAPRIQAAGNDIEQSRDPAARSARLPSLALRVARETLAAGASVLVQVPRRGYVPSLACDRCRSPARCRHCAGPLGQSGADSAAASCRWCARPATSWECPVCGGRRLRASVSGADRTSEELGRAFPGVAIRNSGRTTGTGVLGSIPAGPSMVVATPGAEPVAETGYGAALLLDSWASLGRADLRAGEETLRRWLGAASLVRSADEGGQVIVMADSGHPVVQALIRWDPTGLAERELAERRELGLPPAVRMATLTSSASASEELLALLELPPSAEVLGPVPLNDPPVSARTGGGATADDQPGQPQIRYLIRAPRAEGAAFAKALHAGQAVRSAAKATEHVRVQLDPVDIG
ncbi:MAG: primosomal protein N' [Actinomycetota bacterium]|nr:primosomal protein N' [Actinomycetota bacterium]